VETLTRQLKAFYEEIVNSATAGMQGIDSFLFGTPDIDADSGSFALDELISQPYGVSFRKQGEQSAIRPYVPGTGTSYPVEIASSKTYISEKLRDAVIAGGEAWESLPSREARTFAQIMRDHTVGNNITRWKLAIDTIRNGIFSPLGLKGEPIGLELDFDRDSSLDITYNFTATGATMNKALKALYDAYKGKNGGKNNLTVIMGSDWLNEFENDTTVQKQILANQGNMLLEQNMMPPILQNTFGLRLVARYRVPGVVNPIWICAFEPDGDFIAYKGATAQDFMPSDEIIMFNIGATRYKVQRGVDIFNDSGKIIRAVGDVVFDSFVDPDPTGQVIRSSTRYAFVPANVNHTARSVGTFEEDSES
jgi:hypothetical protein